MHIPSHILKNLRYYAKQFGSAIGPLIGIIGLLIPDWLKIGPEERWGWILAVIAGWAVGVLLVAWGDKEVEKADVTVLREEALLKEYVGLLKESVALLPILSHLDDSGLNAAIVDQLRNICEIAEKFKKDDSEHTHKINVCLYTAFPWGEILDEHLKEAHKIKDLSRGQFTSYLLLSHWAYGPDDDPKLFHGEKAPRVKPCEGVGFVLPVDTSEEFVLLGAPYSYLTGEKQIIEDITSEKLIKKNKGISKLGKDDVDRLIRYFKGRASYKSFASLPVGREPRTGAISLQSQAKKGFRPYNPRDEAMYLAIEPFLDILGILMLECSQRLDQGAKNEKGEGCG